MSYKKTTIHLANTILALVALNAILAILFVVRDVARPVPIHAEPLRDLGAYENMEGLFIRTVVEDFANLQKLGFDYEPWSQFEEPLFKSETVNIMSDREGRHVRGTANRSFMTPGACYTFGGSTTFGYGVADINTWPSCMAQIAGREVVNYGHGAYNPSQETALFISLLRAGRRPKYAIFFDGLNWGRERDQPDRTEAIRAAMKEAQFPSNQKLLERFSWIPMVRAAAYVTRKSAVSEKNEPMSAEQAIQRFQENKKICKAIGAAYEVKTIFVLQPDVIYNYNFELYRQPIPKEWYAYRSQKIDFYLELRHDPDYVDLTQLFKEFGENRSAIVDDCHYSPSFNLLVAQKLAPLIQ